MEVLLAGWRVIVVVGVVEDDRPTAEDEQMAAVGRREHVRIEDQRRRAVSDDRPVDGRDLLEALRGAEQVVGRRDDNLPAAGLGHQDIHQVLLCRRVDAGHGFVEEEQVGPAASAVERGAAARLSDPICVDA